MDKIDEVITVTKSILIKYLRRVAIKRVLEFGSGVHSTPLIRKYMAENNGFCLSLESDENYFNNLISLLPNDQYGEVKIVDLVCTIEQGCLYDYTLSGKFDLFFVDGPAGLPKNQRSQLYKHLKKYGTGLKQGRAGGEQSACIMDHIYPHMHDDSVVVVDFRKGSVAHYIHKHYNACRFVTYTSSGKKHTITSNTNYRVGHTTVIYKKRPK